MSEMKKLNDEVLENVSGGAQRVVNNPSVGYANVRSGPGEGYSVAYKVPNGDCVYTTGYHEKNGGYDWYELTNGCWIAGSLIGY